MEEESNKEPKKYPPPTFSKDLASKLLLDPIPRILEAYSKSPLLERLNLHKFSDLFQSPPAHPSEATQIDLIYLFNIIEILKHLDVSVAGWKSKKLQEIHKGIYEGGFLLWECERDAMWFLASSGMRLDGMDVLEIGAGSGLLGIFMLQLGAKSVTFQDFNAEVLQFWTQYNVIANVGLESAAEKCHFVKGSWEDFDKESQTDVVKKDSCPAKVGKYDIITGCDIIYETKNYPTILSLLKSNLKPSGRAIIASKAYYYGNGGSVNEFKHFLNEKHGDTLEYTQLANLDYGSGNRRDICQIKLK